MSLDSILKVEVHKNNRLTEQINTAFFQLNGVVQELDDLEDVLREWPETKYPDILTKAFAHTNSAREALAIIKHTVSEGVIAIEEGEEIINHRENKGNEGNEKASEERS